MVAGTGQLQVVAAENFYADIASQIGGDQVTVASLLNDPTADPHEYESSPRDAAAVAAAQVLIKNGAGYDGFIDKLVAGSPRPQRVVIDVAQLAGVVRGDNPHVWYRPDVPPRVAAAVAESLTHIDPDHAASFQRNLDAFRASLRPLESRLETIRSKYGGATVLPTEQVANYLLSAAGLRPLHGDFQRAVEEGIDPPARAVQETRQTLIDRRARLLIYNTQATSRITDQMRALAREHQIPVVGVSETLPAGKTFQAWLFAGLEAIENGLAGSA